MGNTAAKGTVVHVGHRTAKIKRLLGQGGFATIFLATECTSGEQVVLKRSRVSVDDNDGILLAKREIEIFERLPPHPHIVRFLASQQHEEVVGSDAYFDFDVMMEYCSGGSVLDEVAAFYKRGESFPEARILRRFRDALLAVAHLHACSPPICHRDLKLGEHFVPLTLLLLRVCIPYSNGSYCIENLLLAELATQRPGLMAGDLSGSADPTGALFCCKLADFGSSSFGFTTLATESSVGLEVSSCRS
jgi:serine/threonine protein kinase